MPALTEDDYDWSDSDEEVGTGVETDILLGVPDGRIETDADIKDAAVSRIGGLPAFIPSREPSFTSSQCTVCSDPMELLLQVWCPFEDSSMDRAMYVWGCARSTCQRRAGSLRAWRGMRYNAAYAARLKEKQARKVKQQKTNTPDQSLATLSNPFSMKPTIKPTPFGFGDQIFGNPMINITHQPEQDDDHCSDPENDSSSEDDVSLVTAMASVGVGDSFWTAAPSYPAIYLSTVPEYIPQPSKAKVSGSARIEDSEVDDKSKKDATWAPEMYESQVKIDSVFDRFSKRVGFMGEQCLRYELKGTPLPFASDKAFEMLFPAATQPLLPVTKADLKVVQPTKRSYSTASIPPCPCCKSNRVFECQLMPNLINVLREEEADVQKMTDEERLKSVQDALKRTGERGGRGMEWGTCMIFSCTNDCCLDDEGKEEKECWREEYVLVQWDEL